MIETGIDWREIDQNWTFRQIVGVAEILRERAEEANKARGEAQAGRGDYPVAQKKKTDAGGFLAVIRGVR